ncbi:hypothetical protein DFH28DRAFT_1063754 [Melampsora americana]|nr:hypothetical protein DFH28DRAFT_1063754 [Melampsora americana]
MNLPSINSNTIFNDRFRKTLLVYFPMNFLIIIFLMYGTYRTFALKVDEAYFMNYLATHFYLIVPWSYLLSHLIYSYFDVTSKDHSSIDQIEEVKIEKDLELGSSDLPTIIPLKVDH